MRSLMDGVYMLNTSNGVQPLRVDTHALLDLAQPFTVDFRGVRGQQTANRELLKSLPRAATTC